MYHLCSSFTVSFFRGCFSVQCLIHFLYRLCVLIFVSSSFFICSFVASFFHPFVYVLFCFIFGFSVEISFLKFMCFVFVSLLRVAFHFHILLCLLYLHSLFYGSSVLCVPFLFFKTVCCSSSSLFMLLVSVSFCFSSYVCFFILHPPHVLSFVFTLACVFY